MSIATTILRRSCRAATSQSLETLPEPCSHFGVPLRWFSCSEQTTKQGTSSSNLIKAIDQYSPVIGVDKIYTLPLSAHVNHCGFVTSKHRYSPLLGFSGIHISRMYSSDARPKPEGPEDATLKALSIEASKDGTTNNGGNTWIDMLDNARHSTIDFSTAMGKKAKDLTDALIPCVQELFDTHPDLEKVAVPLGGTLTGTAMAWFVMPKVLRKLHSHASKSPLMTLLREGDSSKKDISYQTSLWSALEDPAKYVITFMAFSQMAAVIASSISAYLPQAWRGALVVSFVWFLHRWKTNFIANAMANKAAIGIAQERLSTFDKASSLGLVALGLTALAEACGVPVQSILTVGGVGGVATAFAARDVLGNLLSGFSLQFSKPFMVGDYIKMIVNKSRTLWRASMTKIPIRIKDLEKIPAVTEEIKVMLRSNPQIDDPFCYLSRIESSHGELTIGCSIKSMKREEWTSAEQDALLKAASIIKRHDM